MYIFLAQQHFSLLLLSWWTSIIELYLFRLFFNQCFFIFFWVQHPHMGCPDKRISNFLCAWTFHFDVIVLKSDKYNHKYFSDDIFFYYHYQHIVWFYFATLECIDKMNRVYNVATLGPSLPTWKFVKSSIKHSLLKD